MGGAGAWTTFSSNDCGSSLKYEEVYLKDYQLVPEAHHGIEKYFQFYNYQRLHQSLDYRTPATIYGA
jgi:putative transposase